MKNLFKIMTFALVAAICQQTCASSMVNVRTMTGKSVLINIDEHESASSLYQKCSEKFGVPVEDIKLIFMGHSIPNDDQDIAKYQFQKEGPVHLIIKRAGSGASSVNTDAASAGAGTAGASSELASCMRDLEISRLRILELEAIVAAATL